MSHQWRPSVRPKSPYLCLMAHCYLWPFSIFGPSAPLLSCRDRGRAIIFRPTFPSSPYISLSIVFVYFQILRSFFGRFSATMPPRLSRTSPSLWLKRPLLPGAYPCFSRKVACDKRPILPFGPHLRQTVRSFFLSRHLSWSALQPLATIQVFSLQAYHTWSSPAYIL